MEICKRGKFFPVQKNFSNLYFPMDRAIIQLQGEARKGTDTQNLPSKVPI